MKFYSARKFLLVFALVFLTASAECAFAQPPASRSSVVTGTDPEPQPDPPPPPAPKTSVADRAADPDNLEDAALLVLLGLD